MFRALVRVLGTIESLIASLPMPWKMRMWMGGMLGRIMAWIFDHVPGIYAYIINENRRFGMGKNEHGEMQSIRALNRVLREIESQGVSPTRVKEILDQAEKEGITKVHLPRFLSLHTLGEPKTNLLFSHYAGI
jgi:hypothetical protein